MTGTQHCFCEALLLKKKWIQMILLYSICDLGIHMFQHEPPHQLHMCNKTFILVILLSGLTYIHACSTFVAAAFVTYHT